MKLISPSRTGLLFLLSALFCSMAWAGPGFWSGTGPEGGNVRILAVSEALPERIYLAGRGGVFRSDDEGQQWQDISEGLPFRAAWAMATTPTDADRLYVSLGDRLLRTSDAGGSWEAASPGWLPEWGAISVIKTVSSNPAVIYASGWPGGLRRSSDGGDTWSLLHGESQFSDVFGFDLLSADGSTLLMVARETTLDPLSIYRSEDGGLNWSQSSAPVPLGSSARVFSNGSGTVVVLPGALISADDGLSFDIFSPGNLSPSAAVFDPSDPDTWYVGGTNGLLVTNDGGENFAAISGGMAPGGAGGYNAGVTALALKPGSSGVVLVGSEYTGFYRTANAGASWQRRNSGLSSVTVRSLAVNPLNSNIIYAGQGDAINSLAENIWLTFDGGVSWSPANVGLDAGGVRGLALDPNTAASPLGTVLYAAGWSRPLSDVSMPIREASGGVFKTSNGGGGWADIGEDLPLPDNQFAFSVMRSVVLDPSSGSGPEGDGPLQTLYVGGNGWIDYLDDGSGVFQPSVLRHRIYRSDDAGASWVPADNGLPVPEWIDGSTAPTVTVIQLHIDPLDPQTLYASTILNAIPFVNAGLVPTTDNGVFRSTDGGLNWTLASNGLPRFDENEPTSSHRDVLAMAIAPSQPSRLYAATSPSNGFQPSIVFRSDNGGDSWAEVNTGIPDDIDIRWIEVDPDNPDIAYVAGGGTINNPGSIFRTDNGGQEWVSYSIGLPPDSALVLAIDNSGANTVVHAGTTSGVFSIEQVPDDDIDGVPDAIEADAPNGGDGNGDGIPDSVQPEVASLLAPESGRSARRGVSDYITLELIDKGRSQCTRLMSVHALGASAFPVDPGYEYPYGLLRFEIPDCPGAAVRIIFHDLAGNVFDEDWGFRIFAPDEPGVLSTVRWQFMPDAQAQGNAWIIQLADGELGDLRPANNRILFQGGPALVPEPRIFSDRFQEAP